MISRLPGVSVVAIQRLTAGLVIAIVGLWFLGGVIFSQVLSLWVAFIVVTILVVRSVPVEPGWWLGHRIVRRGLVLLIAGCVLMLISPNNQYAVLGAPVLLLLGLFFFLLGRATRRLASAPDHAVDEREEALRNRAHRLAFWILAVVVGGTVLITYLATPDSRAWLGQAIQGGPLVAFFLLLFFLPAMVLAWLMPDRLAGEAAKQPFTGRARLAVSMVAVALIAPVVLALALYVAPIRTTTTVKDELSYQPGASCRYFDARSRVGLGFSAVLPLSAVACWDGRQAFEEWGLNDSDCHLASTEMTLVETTRCSRTTDSSGTLRFVYQARVRSAILPFVTRDVVMTLALAPDGRVVAFP